MANTLAISAPSALGGSPSFIVLRFTVTSGGTTISDTYYNFHANTLTAVYDNSAPNVAVLQFGTSQSVTISNGDYSTIIYAGSAQANVVTAATSIVNAVAAFTT